MGPLRIIPTKPWKLHSERHLKLGDSFYPQVLEEVHIPHGGHMEGEPREQAQPRRWGAERVRTRGQVPLLGSSKRLRDFHWCIWMSLGYSQGRARRGTCGGSQPCHTWCTCHLVRGSRSHRGAVEASGRDEALSIHDTLAVCYGLSCVSPRIHTLEP